MGRSHEGEVKAVIDAYLLLRPRLQREPFRATGRTIPRRVRTIEHPDETERSEHSVVEGNGFRKV